MTSALKRLLRSRDATVLALLLLAGSVIYFTVRDDQGDVGGVAQLDGYYYYVYLRSLQMDGDLDLANEYEQWGNPFNFGKTATGRARNIFGVGPAILWSPFFFGTHLGVLALRGLGSAQSLDGLSRFHQVGTFFGSLIFGWLALVLCYRIAREVVGSRHALIASVGAALAGPLPYYCLSGASYSHAAAAMVASALVLCWLRWRDAISRRRWCWLGALTGLLLLVRPACLPYALLPLAAALRAIGAAAREGDRRALGAALVGPALGAASALLVFAPQLAAWQLMFGTPLTVPQGQGFLWWGDNAWAATLFSPRNGLLTSAPLMAVALAGLVGAAWRSGPSRLLLATFCGFAFLNGAVHDWWGWEFSARRFTSCLPLFTIGLGLGLRWARERLEARPRRTIAWATALLIAVPVLFNLEWTRSFAQKNLKWYQVRSTQGLYSLVTDSMLDRVFRTAGNPLSLPASLGFYARSGGSPRTYDRLGGSYLLGEVNPETNPAGEPLLHAMMDLTSPRLRPNLSEAFGTAVRSTDVGYVPLRRAHGHIFLPLNRPGSLTLTIRARAVLPGTTVSASFNKRRLSRHPLAADRWTAIALQVPANVVRRGINRLDLDHDVPPAVPVSRGVGATGVESAVDVAVASGGLRGGQFCEIWVDGELVSANHYGLNVAVIDRGSGAVLGARGLAVHRHRALYDELGAYLERFPRGSVVALGVRAKVGGTFGAGARRALARIGATSELSRSPGSGYAAIGAIGAPPGTALEQVADAGHALARVGRKPPPWREVARYSAIRLR